MRITGTHLALLGLAFVAGGIVVWILISVVGARPSSVSVGGLTFDVSTPMAPNSMQPGPIQSSASKPVVTSEPRSVSTQPALAESTKGKYPCPMLITQREVDVWKVGQTTVPAVQDALDQFSAKRPDNAGAFVIGTIVPSGVLVATNFDEQDANKWIQYPVVPIIHSGSWGLFQTTGEYTAPNPGACMTIVP